MAIAPAPSIADETVADAFELRDLERVAQFREEYRSRFVGKRYFGPLHAATIFAVGSIAMAAYFKNMKDVKLRELAVVPATFLAGNIGEWAMHNYVMHEPRQGVKAFMGIYTRHTLNHHQFFSRDRMTYDNINDYRIVFFPPYALVSLVGMTAIPAWLLSKVTKSRNTGLLMLATNTGVYMIYELFHWSCHLQDNALLRHIPFVNTIRRHHAAHHDKRMMKERNMNLTFPIADWLFGTSDLDRGLLGHIFNGYNEKYVKPEYRVDELRRRRAEANAARNA